VTRGSVLAQIDPADYRQRVRQFGAQLAEAEASLSRTRADAARAETLYKAEALTRPDYDAAMASVAASLARADAGRAALDQANLALADSSLVAPADGVVLSRNVEIGSLAAAGTVGFTLADLTRVKAVFGVPDQLVSRLRLGATLSLNTEAFPGKGFLGRVTAVSPSADPQSRVFSVEVTVPNAERRLKAGMIASVAVDSGATPDIEPGAATVPLAAVVKGAGPGTFAVFVVEGEGAAARARRREVTLGAISGNRVAVATGLAIGQRIIVSGASLLTDGDRVRLIPGAEGE
jgi:multidrug efflux system membrane fusion protein